MGFEEGDVSICATVARWGRRRLGLLATLLLDAAVVAVAAPDWTEAANIMLVLLAIKSAAFVIVYSWRSNWRATSAGRAVMALIACIATICIVGTIGVLADGYPGRAFVRLGSFIAIGLVLMNLLLVLLQAQSRDDEEES